MPWKELTQESQWSLFSSNFEELQKVRGSVSALQTEAQTLKQRTAELNKSLAASEGGTLTEHLVAPASSLPALEKTSIVDAADLATHYSSDAGTADQRYRKRTFKLKGVVERLEKDFFFRTYTALLRVPGKNTQLACVIKPPESFTKVYSTRNGERMVAEGERSGKVTLMQRDDEVLLEGRCTGSKDGVITFQVTQIVSQ